MAPERKNDFSFSLLNNKTKYVCVYMEHRIHSSSSTSELPGLLKETGRGSLVLTSLVGIEPGEFVSWADVVETPRWVEGGNASTHWTSPETVGKALSNRVLPQPEDFLSKGFNFAIPPREASAGSSNHGNRSSATSIRRACSISYSSWQNPV